MSANRRQFSRIVFNEPIELNQDEHYWHADIIDISLKGILLRNHHHWDFAVERPVHGHLPLAEDTCIDMTLTLRHLQGEIAGFSCDFIDIDSITALRRLVELNLGDTALLERELAHLQEAD
jgi:hypothetical protein